MRILKNTLFPILGVLALMPLTLTAAAQEANQLTAKEKADGWKLLFDGKTTNGWRGFHRDSFPTEGWAIENGTIKHLSGEGAQSQHGGDIITTAEYDNFEFAVDWKITPGANSGIKYLVSEEIIKTGYSGVAFEYQVLDDDRHPDAKAGKNGNRTAGSLYDLIPPKNKHLKPVGEWNHTRIVVNNGRVEHWLNGDKVVEFQIGSAPMKGLIAESKYKDISGFGEVRKGHILLQDHGNEVWFRNIKVRPLPSQM